MSGHGVVFTSESMRALLSGAKTQTRRLVDMRRIEFIGGCGQENDPAAWGYSLDNGRWAVLARGLDERHRFGRWSIPCPHGPIGAQLWVKEAWRTYERLPDNMDGILFRADNAFVPIQNTFAAAEDWVVAHDNNKHRAAWRSSLFMPRWASRLTLRVTDVRVQRLLDITDEDAIAELGLVDHPLWVDSPGEYFESKEYGLEGRSPVALYQIVWERIHGSRAPWASSPWVWAVTFERASLKPDAGGCRELTRLTEEAHGYDKERKE